MKTIIRAAESKQRGRMRPAGRQFDMPDVRLHSVRTFTLSFLSSIPGMSNLRPACSMQPHCLLNVAFNDLFNFLYDNKLL